jgi:polyhydroxybutyrate depolymerase
MDKEHFLTYQRLRRRYLVHVPPGYDGSKRLPLVLSFHGAFAWAEVQRKQSHMNDVADKNDFIVVYPEGTGLLDKRYTWNAGNSPGYAQRENVDDVGFVRALLDELPKQYAVDTKRVYATGMSNGGMLCYRLGCELSERIAAIGVVAADMGVDGPLPKRPVPVIHFHGVRDPIKMFHGGKGKVLGVEHRAVSTVIAWWIKANNCQPEPVEVKKEKDYFETKYAPTPGKKGAPVVLYTIPEGGHTWPGGVDVSAHLGTGKMITTLDASTAMWEFFNSTNVLGERGASAP